MKKKVLICALALIAVIGCTVGGTLAWLSAKTEEVANVFTVGNINIDLYETTTNYKMVPKNEIPKNPTVTVKADSEASYVFIKIDKTSNLDSFIEYTVADGWTALTGVENVYFCEVSATTTDENFAVLKDNKVKVRDNVTKAMMDELETNSALLPKLTFTAYAIQKANIETAKAAWDILIA